MASAPTPTPTASSGMTDNMAAALAYIWFVGLILLFIEPYNKKRFIRFHAFQSVFYAAACFVIWIGLHVVGLVAGAVTSGIAWLLLVPVAALIWLGAFIYWIFLVIQAYNNKETKIPFIGDLAAKQAGS
jgi:uncharacterized membrane protein